MAYGRATAAGVVDEDAAPRRGADDGDASALLVACAPGGACCAAAAAALRAHGACVLDGCLSPASAAAAAAQLQPLLAEAAGCWDADADALPLSWRRWGLSRVPRVSRAKKNLHFMEASALHLTLASLAADAGLEALLSRAAGGARVTLAETGLSLTAGGGCGMEWHADGGLPGEFTVLLALADVAPEQGELGLVPGSHASFAPGEGPAAALAAYPARAWYAYRAGQPVVVDGGTLHAAADNATAAMRCVAWLIFTAELGGEQRADGAEV